MLTVPKENAFIRMLECICALQFENATSSLGFFIVQLISHFYKGSSFILASSVFIVEITLHCANLIIFITIVTIIILLPLLLS